jgi:DNA-binding NtrC family response regulator
MGELAELLGGLDLTVATTTSATDAVRRIRANPPHVIISGHRPPGLDAVSFLEATIAHAPDALRIVIVNTADEAVELDYRPAHAGTIMRFVARPSERSRLVALVAEGIKLLGLVEEQRALTRRTSIEH